MARCVEIVNADRAGQRADPSLILVVTFTPRSVFEGGCTVDQDQTRHQWRVSS